MRLSDNPFFVQVQEWVNRLRHLVDCRSTVDRRRYRSQCTEHLVIRGLVEHDESLRASELMRRHLGVVLPMNSPFYGKPTFGRGQIRFGF